MLLARFYFPLLVLKSIMAFKHAYSGLSNFRVFKGPKVSWTVLSSCSLEPLSASEDPPGEREDPQNTESKSSISLQASSSRMTWSRKGNLLKQGSLRPNLKELVRRREAMSWRGSEVWNDKGSTAWCRSAIVIWKADSCLFEFLKDITAVQPILEPLRSGSCVTDLFMEGGGLLWPFCWNLWDGNAVAVTPCRKFILLFGDAKLALMELVTIEVDIVVRGVVWWTGRAGLLWSLSPASESEGSARYSSPGVSSKYLGLPRLFRRFSISIVVNGCSCWAFCWWWSCCSSVFIITDFDSIILIWGDTTEKPETERTNNLTVKGDGISTKSCFVGTDLRTRTVQKGVSAICISNMKVCRNELNLIGKYSPKMSPIESDVFGATSPPDF